jgi:hypothetical protein
MSLRDLVTFAQNEISRGELFERTDHVLPPLPIRDEPTPQGEGDFSHVPALGDNDHGCAFRCRNR